MKKENVKIERRTGGSDRMTAQCDWSRGRELIVLEVDFYRVCKSNIRRLSFNSRVGDVMGLGEKARPR